MMQLGIITHVRSRLYSSKYLLEGYTQCRKTYSRCLLQFNLIICYVTMFNIRQIEIRIETLPRVCSAMQSIAANSCGMIDIALCQEFSSFDTIACGQSQAGEERIQLQASCRATYLVTIPHHVAFLCDISLNGF